MVYLIIGYMWLFIHRPFEVWPFLGTLRLEFVYMLITLTAWLLTAQKRLIGNPLQVAHGAFAAAVLLCWIASPWMMHERAQLAVENYFKLLVFYVILVTSIRDERELKIILIGFLAAMGLFMAHSFREYLCGRHVYRMGVARLVGVGESLSDPNSYAASILCALPLAKPCRALSEPRWLKKALLGYLGLSILSIVLTGSRTAFVGLGILTFILALRSENRFRNLVVLIIIAGLCWSSLLSDDLKNRFYTLIDPSVGPANAQESAEGRTLGWNNGFALLSRFPLTGCGPGAWIPATGINLESHVLYAQVLGETGLLGTAAFAAVLACLGWNVRAIKSFYRGHPAPRRDMFYELADGVGLGILMLLFLGLGGHNLYRFNWLWYGALLIVARWLIERRSFRARYGLPLPRS
jgi:O-antigen ligase